MTRHQETISAIVRICLLSIIIILTSYLLIEKKEILGPVIIGLGLLTIVPLLFMGYTIQNLKSDIIFGVIDNGILAITILAGTEILGILGAILGGLIGNAITDGIAGIWEGHEFRKQKNNKRTALTVASAKLAGCLLGAGIVLTFAWSL